MTPLVSVRGLVKNYQALRPLRIQQLDVQEGEIVSLLGLDAPAAEMLVGMLTGALLPDEGEIRLFDRSTADVQDNDAWLAMLDGIGIVTERAVLIEQFTIEQNIAIPFTLQVDPVAPAFKPQVETLAREVGLPAAALTERVGQATPEMQVRVRIARALALTPRLLLAEHPSASLPRDVVAKVASDLAAIARARRLAVLTITADADYARAMGGHQLTLEPSTGALKAPTVWRKLFG
jgi:ABC-type lipoprotein export system ATPase subunit